MDCPYCETENTQVINTRETARGTKIWRRRECTKCKKAFSTYEGTGLDFLVVEKRNGKHTRYLAHKLLCSIYDAAAGGKHVDHGDAALLAYDVLVHVEKKMLLKELGVVRTSEIIDMVTDELETRDLGACYRYAAFSPHRGMKFGI